jgi:acyl-CoA-binding protein
MLRRSSETLLGALGVCSRVMQHAFRSQDACALFVTARVHQSALEAPLSSVELSTSQLRERASFEQWRGLRALSQHFQAANYVTLIERYARPERRGA